MSDPEDIAARFRATATRNCSLDAVISDGGRLSYEALLARVESLSLLLSNQCPEDRPRVGILLPNSMAAIVAFLAVWDAGLVAVGLRHHSVASELNELIDRMDLGVLLVATDGWDPTALRISSDTRVVTLAVDGRVESAPVERGRQASEHRSNDVSAVFFTSGTTSVPRGVCHTEASLLASIEPLAVLGRRRTEGTPIRYLVTDPLSHMIGSLHALWVLFDGGTLVLMRGFESDRYLDQVGRHGVTHSTLMVPEATELARALPPSSSALRGLRMLCAAGDRTPLGLRRDLSRLLPLPLVRGYGLSECFVVALDPIDESEDELGVGRVVAGVDARVSVLGELQVRSRQCFVGYWRNPEATRATLRGGWLQTGDLAALEDDMLRIEGRRKHILIRGGCNVSPAEIEAALRTHPSVELAAVVGVRREVEGDVPIAFVQPRTASVTERALLDHLRTLLVDYKIPERVRVLERLPLHEVGKVDRRRLAAQARDLED